MYFQRSKDHAIQGFVFKFDILNVVILAPKVGIHLGSVGVLPLDFHTPTLYESVFHFVGRTLHFGLALDHT